MSLFKVKQWFYPVMVSLAVSLVVGAQTPAAPVLTSPSNGAGGQGTSVMLRWGTVDTAVSYTVQVSTGSDFSALTVNQAGITSASYAVNGLTTGITYYWQVSATSATDSTSPWSAIWSFSTPAVPAPPTLTSPANGAVGQAASVTLHWGTVNTATSYTVVLSTVSDFSVFTDSVKQAGSNANSYVTSGLIIGINYYWMVNATNAVDSTSAWSSVWSFSTLAVPATPTLVAPSNNAANQATSLTLSWNSSARATGYAAEVSTVSTFATSVFYQAGLSGSPAAVSGLSAGNGYYWRVDANDASGTSAWSTVRHFTTAFAVPTLSSPANGATGQALALTLQWGTVPGAISYSVEVAASSTFSATTIDQVGLSANSYAAAGLSNGTTYYWRANATNGTVTSAWSNAWNFTTIVAVPAVPMLLSPTNGTANASNSPTLGWDSVPGATFYSFQLSNVADFSVKVLTASPYLQTTITASNLVNLTMYYWRVSATNAAGTSAWSGVSSFTVNATSTVPSRDNLSGPSFHIINGVISYSLDRECPVEIRIYDMLGQKVFEFMRPQSSGGYSLSAENLNLPSGRYIVRFRAGNMNRTSAMVNMTGR